MRSRQDARARAPAFGAVFAACSALVVLGAGRIAFVHGHAERAGGAVGKPVDERRYAPLEPALAGVRVLGFVAEEGDANPLRSRPAGLRRDPARLYVDAAYALAPRVVVPRAGDLEFVLADVTSPEALAVVRERHGLDAVAVLDNGLALLRRRR